MQTWLWQVCVCNLVHPHHFVTLQELLPKQNH